LSLVRVTGGVMRGLVLSQPDQAHHRLQLQ
jgi:hypothetical protein